MKKNNLISIAGEKSVAFWTQLEGERCRCLTCASVFTVFDDAEWLVHRLEKLERSYAQWNDSPIK